MRRPVIAIRASGGAGVGLGHIRRCLTLANTLQNHGADVCFFVNQDSQTSQMLVRQPGLSVVEVEANEAQDLEQTRRGLSTIGAQALIVDCYDVPENALSLITIPLGAIVDETPKAPLPVHLLIHGAANACDGECPALPRTKLLLGPSFVLLREEFAQKLRREINERAERVLLTTGGCDTFSLSPILVRLVREVLRAVKIDVVIGPYFSIETILQLERITADDRSIMLHRNPADIRNMMLNCDLAVTGGGQTTYELAATGTPTIAIRLAGNQTGNLQGLESRGAVLWAGDVGEPGLEDKIRQGVVVLAQSRDVREKMSRAGRLLVDGRGANRAAEEILQLCG